MLREMMAGRWIACNGLANRRTSFAYKNTRRVTSSRLLIVVLFAVPSHRLVSLSFLFFFFGKFELVHMYLNALKYRDCCWGHGIYFDKQPVQCQHRRSKLRPAPMITITTDSSVMGISGLGPDQVESTSSQRRITTLAHTLVVILLSSERKKQKTKLRWLYRHNRAVYINENILLFCCL